MEPHLLYGYIQTNYTQFLKTRLLIQLAFDYLF